MPSSRMTHLAATMRPESNRVVTVCGATVPLELQGTHWVYDPAKAERPICTRCARLDARHKRRDADIKETGERGRLT